MHKKGINKYFYIINYKDIVVVKEKRFILL